MDRKVDLKNHFDSRKTELCYEDETTCPVCKAKIMPVYIMASLNTDTTASVFNYCQNGSVKWAMKNDGRKNRLK